MDNFLLMPLFAYELPSLQLAMSGMLGFVAFLTISGDWRKAWRWGRNHRTTQLST